MDLNLTHCSSPRVVTGFSRRCSVRSVVGSEKGVESYPFILDRQQFCAGPRTGKVKNRHKKSHKPILSSFILYCLLVRAWLDPWIVPDPYGYQSMQLSYTIIIPQDNIFFHCHYEVVVLELQQFLLYCRYVFFQRKITVTISGDVPSWNHGRTETRLEVSA